MKVRNLAGKSIIFSGGSEYLGTAMLEHLLDCGARVVNIGRRKPEEIHRYPQSSFHYSVDFYDRQTLRDTLDKSVQKLGTVDVLVNNSYDFSQKTGFNSLYGKIEDLTKEVFFAGLESGLY